MPESPQLALSVGDRVVYPKQGVCRVAGIESREIAGQKLNFVKMSREEDGAVMLVPEGKVQSIGLRKIASRDDVTKMLGFLSEDTDKADLDWKQRKVANLDRMSTGGLHGLAEVVKGLQVLSELRPLPTKERELYDDARHLLVMEISASLTMPECDAEDAIDVALFPPGKERPKRTAADFKPPAGDDEGDGLEVGDDLLGMGGDAEPAAEEEEAAEQPEGDEEEAEAKPVRAELSDDEVTLTGTAMPSASTKKRGRPPKGKAVEEPPAKKEKAKAKPAPAPREPPPKAAAADKRGKPAKAPAKPPAKPAGKGTKKK
jgi:CarD family transcriptional regulator